MSATVMQEIRDFLSQHIQTSVIDDAEDIFAAGFVNSLFAMQLVRFIEQSFNLTIGPEDLDIKNFKSIAAMAQFVGRKNAS